MSNFGLRRSNCGLRRNSLMSLLCSLYHLRHCSMKLVKNGESVIGLQKLSCDCDVM